jgi:Protein of unknown function DUF262
MLDAEIEKAQRRVKTDHYSVSVGEILGMYREKELVINPDFQRLFRWEIGQKSKFIESLLLGIPVPPIFVFEREDATWELVDGLQRISTLLEFSGQLRDPTTGQLKPPTALVGTTYLPSLNKVVWETSNLVEDVPTEEQVALASAQQLAIRRSRQSVEILKRPSDNATKYDLFQRLNAGGTAANAQELRNCIIIMVDSNYAAFVREMADYQPFRTVLAPSEEQIEKQRHLEYVSRFLVYTNITYDRNLDVEEYIDAGVVSLATNNTSRTRAKALDEFQTTFRLLDEAYGANALRRFVNDQPSGRVGLAAFECIAVGIARNIASIRGKTNPTTFVKRRIRELWRSPNVDSFFTGGLRGTIRIQRTIPFGTNWFAQ